MYKVIVFTMANQNYALDLNSVSSILEYAEITPVPNSHFVVSGLINVRGELYSVIDMGKVLGASLNKEGSKIILLDEQKLGLHVQDTKNVITVTEDSISEINTIMGSKDVSLIENVINNDGIVIELSTDKILNFIK